jgi:hypothetical protein
VLICAAACSPPVPRAISIRGPAPPPQFAELVDDCRPVELVARVEHYTTESDVVVGVDRLRSESGHVHEVKRLERVQEEHTRVVHDVVQRDRRLTGLDIHRVLEPEFVERLGQRYATEEAAHRAGQAAALPRANAARARVRSGRRLEWLGIAMMVGGGFLAGAGGGLREEAFPHDLTASGKLVVAGGVTTGLLGVAVSLYGVARGRSAAATFAEAAAIVESSYQLQLPAYNDDAEVGRAVDAYNARLGSCRPGPR